jgi:hypothetical protein
MLFQGGDMFNDEIGVVLSAMRLLSVIGLLVACGSSVAGSLAAESASPGLRWLRMTSPDSPAMIAATPSESVAGRHFEIYLGYRSGFAGDAHWAMNNGLVPQAIPSAAEAKDVADRACVSGTPVFMPSARDVDR